MYVCVYIYVCIYIYMCVYIYTYIFFVFVTIYFITDIFILFLVLLIGLRRYMLFQKFIATLCFLNCRFVCCHFNFLCNFFITKLGVDKILKLYKKTFVK